MRSVYTLVLFLSVHLVLAQDFKELMNKSDRLYAKGDFNQALELYQKAEALQPNNVTVQMKIGLTYLSTSSFKYKALPYLQKAVQAQPNIDQMIDDLKAIPTHSGTPNSFWDTFRWS